MPSVSSLIDFSWKKTKEILFPFNFKRWIKILFVVWLSGHAAGLGGNYRPSGGGGGRAATPAQVSQTQTSGTATPSVTSEESIAPTAPTTNQAENPKLPPINPILVVLIVLIMVPIWLVFAWLGARFNFIFLDVLTTKEVRIKESFRNHKEIGNSYFLFSLVFGLSVVAILVVLGIMTALIVTFAKILLILVIPAIIFVVIGLILAGTALIDFVLPMIYADKIKAYDACKKFLASKPNWGQIGLYILLKMGLGIVSGIIMLVIAIVCFIAFLIGGVIIAIPTGIVAAALPFLKPILIIAGVILLVAAIFALIVAIGLTVLPIPVFFRVLAVSYLYRLFPQYNLLSVPSE